jgi:hypothetical protein
MTDPKDGTSFSTDGRQIPDFITSVLERKTVSFNESHEHVWYTGLDADGNRWEWYYRFMSAPSWSVDAMVYDSTIEQPVISALQRCPSCQSYYTYRESVVETDTGVQLDGLACGSCHIFHAD